MNIFRFSRLRGRGVCKRRSFQIRANDINHSATWLSIFVTSLSSFYKDRNCLRRRTQLWRNYQAPIWILAFAFRQVCSTVSVRITFLYSILLPLFSTEKHFGYIIHVLLTIYYHSSCVKSTPEKGSKQTKYQPVPIRDVAGVLCDARLPPLLFASSTFV